MITKIVQLEFANPKLRAVDYLRDLREAARSASLNLFSRHRVQLQDVVSTKDDKVVIEVKIPDDYVGDFTIGNHLRGISSYLLAKYGLRYKDYLVGNRLLNYIEVTEPNFESEKMTMAERLEAISLFARLLKRSDEEALNQIRQIVEILNEIV